MDASLYIYNSVEKKCACGRKSMDYEGEKPHPEVCGKLKKFLVCIGHLGNMLMDILTDRSLRLPPGQQLPLVASFITRCRSTLLML